MRAVSRVRSTERKKLKLKQDMTPKELEQMYRDYRPPTLRDVVEFMRRNPPDPRGPWR